MQKFFIEREGGSKTNYVISCSFGKDSLAQVILAHQHGEPVEYILYVEVMYDIERNISAEIPEHRDFIYNIAIPKLQEWGYRVIVLRSEKDFKYCFLREIKKAGYQDGMEKGVVFRCRGNVRLIGIANRELLTATRN